MKYYAGIGSRKTPDNVLQVMQNLGFMLSELRYILRSGHAIGADLAFENGCNLAHGLKEIFLANDAEAKAMALAASVHPYWYSLSAYAQKLHARNGYQILGKDLKTPSDFVLCWTPDGADGDSVPTSPISGGTGQAIRLANRYKIPVINLKNENWKPKLQRLLATKL